MSDAIDRQLVTAVAVAIQPQAQPEALDPIDIGARAICELYGPHPGCLCGTGVWKVCHAKHLYRDHVTAVLLAFKRAGIIPRKTPKEKQR